MANSLQHAFVTSDHHFGSWRLPGPFAVFSQEQEKELIEKWNSVVGKDDLVYYNGDFSDAGTIIELCHYIEQLNGNIILIQGNHDRFPFEVYKAIFKDIANEIVLKDLELTIHHQPMHIRRGAAPMTTKYEVFGHLHRGENLEKMKGFCSCVQFNDGYPVSLERVLMSLR